MISKLRCLSFAGLLCVCFTTTVFAAQPVNQNLHTDPINLTPQVREAHDLFYNLDYDGALSRFEAIQRANPQNPMASNYILMTLIFRELYHQDLLDTTYYAHNSFLFTKREVNIPKATRDRIEQLTNHAIALCDEQLRTNPNDANAYFARGYARGMHAAFITLADHSFVAAARQGYASRGDSEQALKIDPDYADAKMAVGIQQFAVASLPRFIRIMIGVTGVTGNKEKGLQLLREAAAHGVVNNVESRTALSLFLRHDGRYEEAIVVQRAQAEQYPHDYLFRLEEANLIKDKGDGPAAIATYKRVLEDARKPNYFTDPRLQLAYFGLADTQRGQNLIADAAENYLQAAAQPNCTDWLRKRAQLNAGEMFDLLHQRDNAITQYRKASASGGDQSQAETARRYLKVPYGRE
ncbi:tetratricopeptide repeat protein [Edaphobacter bradus]|uniref:tetratricopeptide repeat protein n=1 Tax=Edaphobacter bradus TaxID=2259016 RepID=UPI0021E09EE9|nr:TTC39/IML2 family protein [Edaphobacter bradus]